MRCKNCKNEDCCIKYGKHPKDKNVQRYKCKRCGHTFYDVCKHTYQRNSKRILSLLLRMLENNFFDKTEIEDALTSAEEYYRGVKEIKLKTKYYKNYKKRLDEYQKNPKNTLDEQIKIECCYPKVLICEEHRKITLIQIPERINKETVIREIIIKDNKGIEGLKEDDDE